MNKYQVDNEKGPTEYNRELSWTNCNTLYEKTTTTKQKKNRCLCITESSSGTPKTKHRKSTLLQYKITIQLQIKLPELGLRETRQLWPYELDMWYAMILIWHHQRFSLSRTQSSNPHKCAWPHVNATRWIEQKGPQFKQGNTLSSDVGNLQGDKTHGRQRIDTLSLCTQDPDSGGWGETHTIPRLCTWGPMTLG